MPLFISLKKYNDLIELCSREQGRAQSAKLAADRLQHQVNQLLADNDMLGRLSMYHKKRADRLEYAAHHPRQRDGQFRKIIPIRQGGQS